MVTQVVRMVATVHGILECVRDFALKTHLLSVYSSKYSK